MVELNRCFNKDPNWTRETVQLLKKNLGLKTSQIYKWGYDRKKLTEKEKENELEERIISTKKSNIKDYNNAVFEICESITKNRRFEKNAKIQGKLVSSKLQCGKNELTLDSKAENKSSTNEDSSILPTSKILFNENSKYIISDPIKIVPSNPIQSLICTEIQKDDFNILQKSSQLTNNQLFANDSKDIYYNWKNISCEDSMYYQHKNCFHSYFTNFKSYSEEPEIINTEKVKEPDLSSEAEEALNPIYELCCQDFCMNLDTC